MERQARINNLTAKDNFKLHGMTPHTATLAEEGDISSLCQFGWYEWCYYHEQTAAFPHNHEVLGRVLGPARGEGNEMAHSTVENKKRDVFNALIERRMGTSINPLQQLRIKIQQQKSSQTLMTSTMKWMSWWYHRTMRT